MFACTALTQDIDLRVGAAGILRLKWLPVLYGVGIEVLQLTGFTDGHADPLDVGAALIGWCTGLAYLRAMNFIAAERRWAAYATAVCFALLWLGDQV